MPPSKNLFAKKRPDDIFSLLDGGENNYRGSTITRPLSYKPQANRTSSWDPLYSGPTSSYSVKDGPTRSSPYRPLRSAPVHRPYKYNTTSYSGPSPSYSVKDGPTRRSSSRFQNNRASSAPVRKRASSRPGLVTCNINKKKKPLTKYTSFVRDNWDKSSCMSPQEQMSHIATMYNEQKCGRTPKCKRKPKCKTPSPSSSSSKPSRCTHRFKSGCRQGQRCTVKTKDCSKKCSVHRK